MPRYHRFDDLVQAGRVNNRMTLKRHIDAGLFPPPVNLGPNTVAWFETDLEEFDRRVMEGITQPNPDWLARARERRARRSHAKRSAIP